MQLADLVHGGWYRVSEYPDIADYVFQMDLLYGPAQRILLKAALPPQPDGVTRYRYDVLELAQLAAYLTPTEQPAGMTATVDPNETPAQLARRALRHRLGLARQITQEGFTLTEDDESDHTPD